MPRKPSPSPNHNHHHHHHHHNPNSLFTSPLLCRHFPTATATATLDLLILILVLFSGAFLIISYLSYLFHSLSLLLLHYSPPSPYLIAFVLSSSLTTVAFSCLFCGSRSRKCSNPSCRGLKKALEFDLQLHTEDSLKSGPNQSYDLLDRLPWKGADENNPDYECLRAELRKMAPPNGRAVLLFRSRCGCPVSKLIGWGPKRGRKHKKAISNSATNGKGDHR